MFSLKLMIIFIIENCYISKKDFEHGEKPIMGTKSCSCNDGTMNCELLVCANLTCPEDKQISVPDEYCKYCRGIIFKIA